MRIVIEKRKQLTVAALLACFMKESIWLRHVTGLSSREARRSKDMDELYQLGTSFDWYREPSDASITKDMICYLDDCVTVTDEDEEVYPDFCQSKGLEFCYSGEQFIDVLLNAYYQTATPDMDTLVQALNHYAEMDCYLDIAPQE